MTNLSQMIDSRLDGAVAAISSLRDQHSDLLSIINAVQSALAADGTIYTCGNGGSAAEALHLAEELTGRYRSNRAPLPAVSLNADPTAITCIGNDFGFNEIFARPLSALANHNDVLIAFSTSGESKNIIRALEAGQSARLTTIGLLGKGGGAALELCDHALVVRSSDTAHIQESHQVVLHLILEAIEIDASKS